MLLDEEATMLVFKQRFAHALIDRARANDIAVFYYADHNNRDEPDETRPSCFTTRSDDASG